MALQQDELFSQSTQTFQSNWDADSVIVGKFGDAPAGFAAGELVLAVGTAVAYNTANDEWVVYNDGGSNGENVVSGFVYPDAITLNANTGDEVLGQIMLTGSVDYDVLVTDHDGDGAGYTEANLQAELRANARAKGLIIRNLTNIR